MKPTTTRSIHQIVDDQILKWEHSRKKKTTSAKPFPMVSISREPGSGGSRIGEKLAEKLGLDLFHKELIQEVAQSARVTDRIVEVLDEKGLNTMQEYICSIIDRRHLWPDQYLKHLLRVCGTIAQKGNAVVIGRGTQFAVPAPLCFRVRVVAPRKKRVDNLAETFGLDTEEMEKRVLRTEAERRAFVRKYFYADISDPLNYDMVINTSHISIDAAVHAVGAALEKIRG